jgi:hypothetical protein
MSITPTKKPVETQRTSTACVVFWPNNRRSQPAERLQPGKWSLFCAFVEGFIRVGLRITIIVIIVTAVECSSFDPAWMAASTCRSFGILEQGHQMLEALNEASGKAPSSPAAYSPPAPAANGGILLLGDAIMGGPRRVS